MRKRARSSGVTMHTGQGRLQNKQRQEPSARKRTEEKWAARSGPVTVRKIKPEEK